MMEKTSDHFFTRESTGYKTKEAEDFDYQKTPAFTRNLYIKRAQFELC